MFPTQSIIFSSTGRFSFETNECHYQIDLGCLAGRWKMSPQRRATFITTSSLRGNAWKELTAAMNYGSKWSLDQSVYVRLCQVMNGLLLWSIYPVIAHWKSMEHNIKICCNQMGTFSTILCQIWMNGAPCAIHYFNKKQNFISLPFREVKSSSWCQRHFPWFIAHGFQTIKTQYVHFIFVLFNGAT